MPSPTRRSTTLTGAMAQHAKNKSAPGLILPKVKDHMLKEYGWDSDRDPTVIHPSEMAKDDWCLRATYLRIISGAWPPDKEKFDYVRENIFAAGNDIHEKWQNRIIAAGFPMWGDWECSVCGEWARNTVQPDARGFSMQYGDGPLALVADNDECLDYYGGHRWAYREVTLNAREQLLIAGHSDGAFDNSLIEIKSIGLGTIRIDAPDLLKEYQEGKHTDLAGLWKGITKPLKSHLIQGDVYLHLAHVLGLPFDQIVYLYEFKANQMTKEFTVKYSPVRSGKLVAKADKIKYAVDHGIPPECIKPGECKQCNAFPQRRTVAGTRNG